MKIYLVGGAVRDERLGLPVQEKDWVVVGATVPQMLKLGYRPVGKDFPVFLHPQTQEEYALARTERKVAKGYTGFTFNASPDVTLEEDLQRRDLTINAMAKTPEGVIVDPYHGQEDLDNKLLRHVSPAFIEDPVRILRVARFAARYAALGFQVAQPTIDLMKQMVALGEVNALVAERVWKEWQRALTEKNPEKFFQVLESCDALSVLFPGITDEGVDLLRKAALLTDDPVVRFAVLVAGAYKGRPSQSLYDRYKVPNEYGDLALLVERHQTAYLESKTPEGIVDLLTLVDAFRRKQRFQQFLLACEMIFHSKAISEKLMQCFAIASTINIQPILEQKLSGNEIANQIKQLRIEAIAQFLSTNFNN
jgi:tRNA nucleotidyltransferase (CCA-adding enzyme)